MYDKEMSKQKQEEITNTKEKNLYYTAPSNEEFEEVKAKAIEIWNDYSNEFGYRDEKINQIKNLQNISDNVMYIVAMFDMNNQVALSMILSPGTRKAISDRMKAGGNPPEANPFEL